MKIAIIADTHDRLDMIRKAVERIKALGAELVIHCGDFVAPFSIPPFASLRIPFVSVFGNNDGEKKGLEQKILSIGGIVRQPPLMKELGGKQFLISHEPLDEEKLKQKFNHIDFFLFGHTHEVVEKEINGIKVINPGEACGWISEKATFVVLETESKKAEIIQIK